MQSRKRYIEVSTALKQNGVTQEDVEVFFEKVVTVIGDCHFWREYRAGMEAVVPGNFDISEYPHFIRELV